MIELRTSLGMTEAEIAFSGEIGEWLTFFRLHEFICPSQAKYLKYI
jgi:hypothetical protein